MLFRILLILAIFWLLGFCAMWYFKYRLRRMLAQFQAPQPTATPINSEQLVECQTCHTFFPRASALNVENKYYCCKEHVNSAK